MPTAAAVFTHKVSKARHSAISPKASSSELVNLAPICRILGLATTDTATNLPTGEVVEVASGVVNTVVEVVVATRLSLKGLGAAVLAVETLWGSWERDYARSIGTSRNFQSSRKISTSNILLFRVAQKELQMTGVGPKRSSSTGMAFLSQYSRLKKLPCLNTFSEKF